MYDIEIPAMEGAAALSRLGRLLGDAGIGLEGGGVWNGVAHYLVHDGPRAADVLQAAGVGPVTVRVAVLAELDADVPGALSRLMGRLDEAGVGLLAQYSDHDNRKVLVSDDPDHLRQALQTTP